MPMQNPFSNPAFTAANLSAAITELPNNYMELGSRGLFRVKGSASNNVAIAKKTNHLVLLPTKQRGDPGTMPERSTSNVRVFKVPHVPHDDVILPEDVQDVLAFGGNQVENIATLVANRLQEMKDNHEQTHEWMRMGALKGKVLDADGASVIYDFYDEFGINKVAVDFVLDTDTTDVRAKCLTVKRHIERNLNGDVMTGVDVAVSPTFFDKLTNHPNVKATYANWQAAQERLGGDLRNGFPFGGLRFWEYNATVSKPDGNTVDFITDGYGHAYPVGTRNTFLTVPGPADFNEAVNKLGQVHYAKVEERKFARGYDLHTQSNPLIMCMRPQVLVELVADGS